MPEPRPPRMQFDFGSTRIELTTPDRDTLLQELRARLREGRGFTLATINLDHLVKLGADERFRAAYHAHDLVVADGNPIVWLSRLARRPVALVPGSDLIAPLAALATETGAPVALFGADGATLEHAAAHLCAAHPGLRIAACIAPPMGFDPTGAEAQAHAEALAAAGVRLCLIALGAPKQEEFAAFARQFAPATGFVSIGAGLDFLSGRQIRAPRLVRALALEWLWRMLSQPRRLAGRYASCFWILPRHIRAAWQLRKAAP